MKVASYRREQFMSLHDKGFSYGKIGKLYGISRQRVHQIISLYQRVLKGLKNDKHWYKQLEVKVLKRDDYKCQKCFGVDDLLIHHIDGNDENNALNNLVTLCSLCHLNLHRPENSFGEYNRSRGSK